MKLHPYLLLCTISTCFNMYSVRTHMLSRLDLYTKSLQTFYYTVMQSWLTQYTQFFYSCCYSAQAYNSVQKGIRKKNMAEIELSEGVTYEELSGPLYEKFKEHMLTMSQGFVRLQPYNQVMPRNYLNFEKKVKEFPTKADDVWVASFPKCGMYHYIGNVGIF